MKKKIVALSILICAVLVIVTGAPLATADSHHVVKGAQGPRASIVSWVYAPNDSGIWTGHIVNSGLRTLVVDVMDVTAGTSSSILHQRIRFATYPTDTVDTDGAIMAKSHKYNITVTPNGAKGTSCVVDDVYTVKSPPVAMFTYVVDGATVIVDGSASYDPSNETITAWAWDWGDGGIGSGAISNHTYAASGTYTITLTVLSGTGLWTSTSHDVLVAIDEPPVPSFNATATSWTVSVDASSSHDDYGIESYSWDWGDGSAWGSGIVANHTYSASNSYNITLTVTNTKGLTGSLTEWVTVLDLPPVASFTLTASGLTVSVDASSSYDDYGIVSYLWHWGDSTTGAGITASHTYAAPALYALSLTVTDTVGQTNTVTHAPPVTEPPVGAFTMTVSGFTVMCDATTSTSDFGIVSYEWEWGDSSSGTGVTATHTYAAQGWYTITLTVTDAVGQTNSIAHIAPIGGGMPPLASFTATVNGATVNVDASASTDSYGIVSYDWNWGDHVIGRPGVTSSHAYISTNTYTITLTVTNTHGVKATTTKTVSIVSNIIPGFPYLVYGTTYASDGVTQVAGCMIAITDVRTGTTLIDVVSYDNGFYSADITPLWELMGDTIVVQAMGPAGETGSGTGVIGTDPYLSVDVTLSG